MLDEGRDVSAIAYQEALDGRDVLNAGLEAIFDRFDAVVTPAATGQAPRGLATTGDPVFSTLWTYCGVPALSLPLLEGGRWHAARRPTHRPQGRRRQAVAHGAMAGPCDCGRGGRGVIGDRILSLLSLLAFAVFLGTVLWFVPEIDLIVITLVVIGIAANFLVMGGDKRK